MHLDLAVAPRQAAEAAFFDTDDGMASDDVPRFRLDDLSEFELAHLAIALTGSFEPRLALDGDCPEDIVSEADPAFVAALADLQPADREALIARWRAVLADAGCAPEDPDRLPTALDALQELAALAMERHHGLLYTQALEDYPLDPELD